jgi:hypothetical protein
MAETHSSTSVAPRGPLCTSQDAGALLAARQLLAELFALEGAGGIRNAQLKCSDKGG